MHVIIITSNVGHTWLGAAADAMQTHSFLCAHFSHAGLRCWRHWLQFNPCESGAFMSNYDLLGPLKNGQFVSVVKKCYV